jgi:hypothetical protein
MFESSRLDKAGYYCIQSISICVMIICLSFVVRMVNLNLVAKLAFRCVQPPCSLELMISLTANHFRDSLSRAIIFRGINVSGSSKYPHAQTTHSEPKPASFVGRPFPLAEADTHFARLKAWGITLIRWVITWEALEPNTPGVYDQDFIQYTVDCIKIANKYDIKVIIDPHQDTVCIPTQTSKFKDLKCESRIGARLILMIKSSDP